MRPDNEIAVSVANLIKWHVAVDSEKINIEVKKGIVTLKGWVDWGAQRQAIEEMVRCLPGVARLDNLINIRPRSTSASIRDAILSALRDEQHPDADAIHVEVAANTVVLRGTVRDWEARESAEQLAWANRGVYAVENKLEIAVPVYLL